MSHPDLHSDHSAPTTAVEQAAPLESSPPVGTGPTQRPRRRWLRYVATVGVGTVLLGLGVTMIDLVTNDSESATVRFDQQIDRLVLDVANGDVHIIGSDQPAVVIEVVTHGGIRAPHHDETASDGDLTIEAGCGLGSLTPTCSIDYVVHAPSAVDIVARGSATDYDVRDTTGDVDISLDGGDADMRFGESPNLVRARSNGGDIDITVPAGLAHHVIASADGGSTHIDVATDPDSAHLIDAHANGGDITIGRHPSGEREGAGS